MEMGAVMSRKALFYIALNAAIAALGLLALRNVAKYTPDRKVRPNPIAARRSLSRAIREGRVRSVEKVTVYLDHGKPVRTVRCVRKIKEPTRK